MSRLERMLERCCSWVGIEQIATSHTEKLLSALGAFVGIAGVFGLSHWYLEGPAVMLVIASMGASAVLLFAVPHGTLSQPWPLMVGHLVSAAIGVTCQKLLPDATLAGAAAVGLAVGAMYYLRCIHPPGGATALTAVVGGDALHAIGYQFVLFPVGINALVILLVAVLFNSPFSWRRYPGHFARPTKTAVATPSVSGEPRLTHEDFAAAMEELNSLIDVTPEDLAAIFESAARHAVEHDIHPATISLGSYYSNGRLGRDWSVRQVIDASERQLIYKVVAGAGTGETGFCSEDAFRAWARFEVFPSGTGHWRRRRMSAE